MPLDADELRAHAATYLFGAGWLPAPSQAPGCLSMLYRGSCVSLAIRLEPAQGRADLRITLTGRGALGGVFRDRSAELRVFARGPELLGFLCFLTASQDELSEDSADEWLGDLVGLCPGTYAVISPPGVPEALARVAHRHAAHVLH